MKKLIPFLLILVVIFSSCNSQPQAPAETSDLEITSDSISISPETTIPPETESETEPEVTWYYPSYVDNYYVAPTDTEEHPEEIKNTYLTFPLIYETTSNGFEYTVEFYTDTVYMYDHIFLRTTVTNISDSTQSFICSHTGTGYFKKDDDELFKSHSNNYQFSDDTSDRTVLGCGQSVTFEVWFRADPEFFNIEHSYVFVVAPYPVNTDGNHQLIEIPIPINIAV